LNADHELYPYFLSATATYLISLSAGNEVSIDQSLTDSHPAQSYALTPIFFLRLSGSMLDPASVTDAITPCVPVESEKRNPQTTLGGGKKYLKSC
jgi:hypothetical protein